MVADPFRHFSSEADGGGGGEEGEEEEGKEEEEEEEEATGTTKTGRMAGKRGTVTMSVRASVRAERASAKRTIICSIFDNESRMGGVGVGVASFSRRHEGEQRRGRRRGRRR